MGAQEQGDGLFLEGLLVVSQVNAISRTNLYQPGSRLFHHIRDAKATANLYQLGAGNGHPAPAGKGGKDEQHC